MVRTARHVAAFDQTAKALDVGDITAAHVTIAAQAAKHREELLPGARGRDPRRGAEPAPVRRSARSCSTGRRAPTTPRPTSPTPTTPTTSTSPPPSPASAIVDGRFDPIAVKALIDRLDAMEPPDPTDGPRPPRTLAQRRAAALMRLVCGDQPPRIGIDILIDHETLAGRPAADPEAGLLRDRRPRARSPRRWRAPSRATPRSAASSCAATRRCSTSAAAPASITPGTPPHPGDPRPHLRRTRLRHPRRLVRRPPHRPVGSPRTDDLDNLELRCRRHHVAAHRRLDQETASEAGNERTSRAMTTPQAG